MREVTEEELHAYVDDVLTVARRLDVALYLAATPSDAARAECFRAQKEGLRALFDQVLREALPERLRAAVSPGNQDAPAPPSKEMHRGKRHDADL
jgi:anti-sigma factor RsiW